MVLQESGEMYLESILVLIRQGKAVRSIDIVDYMGYSKPSVSRAVGLLKAGQYIDVDNGGYITLTAAGREVAEKIYERHTVLTDFPAAWVWTRPALPRTPAAWSTSSVTLPSRP